MRWIITLLFAAGFFFANGQACIPNNDTVSGIEPDTLAPAIVQIPYEEVIYFRLPADTVVDLVFGGYVIYDVHLCIDSLTIDSVQGLPQGFSYACHVPWCSVKGGDNGCAKISGTATPDQVGIYPLQVFVTIYVNDCYSFSLPATPDTITFFYLQVLPQSGAEPFREIAEGLGLPYPNPSNGRLYVPVVQPTAGMVLFRISDLTGRTLFVQYQELTTPAQVVSLDINLPAGTYLLELINEHRSYRRTVVISGR
ncbi:MAG: T9SS type A sorting domain-containing protein [Chitinophagales bacterium]|nr:T9SS type A sorting domain-containing protein [Chitinophagales bacterium]